MRYFKSTNASRPFNAGGFAFSFEPVGQIGGSWFGILAVEESAAKLLAEKAYPQITELTQEEYEAEKKSPQPKSSHSFEFPAQPQPKAPESVPAPSVAAAAQGSPESPTKHQAARVDPPDELIHTEPVKKLGKRVRKP